MKTKLSVALAAAGCALALSVGAARASVVYGVDLSVGAGSVTGTITTDGTTGTLSSGNITAWDLKLSDGSNTFVLQPSVTSTALIFGNQTSATATGLFFNFGGTGLQSLIFEGSNVASGQSDAILCFGTTGSCFAGVGAGITLTGGPLTNEFTAQSGLVEIGQAVPLPTALPLFATGLGGLGLLGWRRKRKAKAVWQS